MVDSVQSAKLGEEASIWNIFADILPAVDALGPVISPIVHAARLNAITSNIVDVVASSPVGDRPVRKGL